MYRTWYLLGATGLLVISFGQGASAAEYFVSRLGLSDALHTRDDGYQTSTLNDFSVTGYRVGASTAYNDDDDYGTSGWWSDGHQTIRLGLFDSEHRADLHPNVGAYFSSASGVNAGGIAVGTSNSYAGQGTNRSSWMFDGQEITRLGFVDTAHIGLNSERETIVQGRWLNENNDILGFSRRYNGTSNPNIKTTWLHHEGQYHELGLTHPYFLHTDGRPNSEPVELNEAGQAIGFSTYSAFGGSGYTAWLADVQGTTPIGLVTPETLDTSYWLRSEPMMLNEAGQVVGYAHPDNSTTALGYDAIWLYDGQTTARIGLYGDGYIYSPTGHNTARATRLSESGHVLGRSYRWNQGALAGPAAWIYHDGVTTEIGLDGTEFTRSDGYMSSTGLELNDAGMAVGSSARYSGEDFIGDALWHYDGVQTTRIGRFDPAHTRSDGEQNSTDLFLTQNGDVGGYSNRYDGMTRDGITLWYYDYSADETIDVAFVPSPYASSNEGGLSDSLVEGKAFGYAKEYEGTQFVDWDVFTWSLDAGRESLLPHIAPSGDAALFEWLLYVLDEDVSGRLYGRGQLYNGGITSFVLTPITDGDYNLDGVVNLADYTLWRDNYGAIGTNLAADGNGDTMVDADDYGVWKMHFGETTSSGIGQFGTGVPEPAALATILCAIATICLWPCRTTVRM